MNRDNKIDFLCNGDKLILNSDILNMINNNNISYTDNNNGIFLNISLQNDEIIDSLYNFKILQDNSEEINLYNYEDHKYKEDIKEQYKNIIKDVVVKKHAKKIRYTKDEILILTLLKDNLKSI